MYINIYIMVQCEDLIIRLNAWQMLLYVEHALM